MKKKLFQAENFNSIVPCWFTRYGMMIPFHTVLYSCYFHASCFDRHFLDYNSESNPWTTYFSLIMYQLLIWHRFSWWKGKMKWVDMSADEMMKISWDFWISFIEYFHNAKKFFRRLLQNFHSIIKILVVYFLSCATLTSSFFCDLKGFITVTWEQGKERGVSIDIGSQMDKMCKSITEKINIISHQSQERRRPPYCSID